jgi:hypothetical protein
MAIGSASKATGIVALVEAVTISHRVGFDVSIRSWSEYVVEIGDMTLRKHQSGVAGISARLAKVGRLWNSIMGAWYAMESIKS